jgi:hypothetical protein
MRRNPALCIWTRNLNVSTTMSDKAVPVSRARRRAPAPLSRRRNRAALLFLLPGGLLFAIYVIYPIISSIVLSFYSRGFSRDSTTTANCCTPTRSTRR